MRNHNKSYIQAELIHSKMEKKKLKFRQYFRSLLSKARGTHTNVSNQRFSDSS